MLRLLTLLLIASLPLPLSALAAESNVATSEFSRVQLLSETDELSPGKTVWLGLSIQLAPGWHTYTDPPGDAGLPIELSWQNTPDGISFSPLLWPTPKSFAEGDLTTYGYDTQIIIPVRATSAQTFSKNKEGKVKLTAKAKWMICNEICIPEEATLSLPLNVKATATSTPSPHAETLHQAVKDLPAGEWNKVKN